jgi:quercetin dioxygenase-like cupin family protein
MKIISLSLLAIVALAVNAGADEPKAAAPQAVRNILERHDQSGVQNKEIVIGTATLPPGSAIGFHTHPGDESGYVLKGPWFGRCKDSPIAS